MNESIKTLHINVLKYGWKIHSIEQIRDCYDILIYDPDRLPDYNPKMEPGALWLYGIQQVTKVVRCIFLNPRKYI